MKKSRKAAALLMSAVLTLSLAMPSFAGISSDGRITPDLPPFFSGGSINATFDYSGVGTNSAVTQFLADMAAKPYLVVARQDFVGYQWKSDKVENGTVTVPAHQSDDLAWTMEVLMPRFNATSAQSFEVGFNTDFWGTGYNPSATYRLHVDSGIIQSSTPSVGKVGPLLLTVASPYYDRMVFVYDKDANVLRCRGVQTTWSSGNQFDWVLGYGGAANRNWAYSEAQPVTLTKGAYTLTVAYAIGGAAANRPLGHSYSFWRAQGQISIPPPSTNPPPGSSSEPPGGGSSSDPGGGSSSEPPGGGSSSEPEPHIPNYGDGYSDGYEDGYSDGYVGGYEDGGGGGYDDSGAGDDSTPEYESGYRDGYSEGYGEGYGEGLRDGGGHESVKRRPWWEPPGKKYPPLPSDEWLEEGGHSSTAPSSNPIIPYNPESGHGYTPPSGGGLYNPIPQSPTLPQMPRLPDRLQIPSASSDPFANVTVPEAKSDPFASIAVPEASNDPFASITMPEAKSDPFASIAVPEVSNDPFASIVVPEASNDPFASIAVPEASNDPFASIAVPEASNDPFASIAVPEVSNDPFASIEIPQSDSNPFGNYTQPSGSDWWKKYLGG